MKENNPFFGWILQENPNFWEDNGYKKINSSNFHYYGCNMAKINKYPVYRKHLYICHDMEEDSMVEVFPCGIGVVNHDYIVAIHTWNNAGGSKFSLDIVKQVSTIDSFNALISEYIGEELEDGTYLLKKDKIMKQYISKSALVAEIDKWKEDARKGLSDYAEGVYDTYEKILLFLDTLEVKEVDLEKEIRDAADQYDINNDGNIYWEDIVGFAKHFFELGLKAQKGE